MNSIDPAETHYFSEGGEDWLLWNLFGYKRSGTYIDVGAFDGRYLSNSLSFARAGWRGVCVEPVADYADLCKTNQPGAVCVRAACVGDPDLKSVTFHEEALGVYSRLELAEDARRNLERSYQKYGADLPGFQQVETPATTLSRLIDEHFGGSALDFISIDVEGNELTVLDGLDFERHRPRVIIAEANDEEHKVALISRLAERGYEFVRGVSNNYFFSNEPELVARGKEMLIKCVIERHLHPRGLQYTFRGIALGKVIDEPRQKEVTDLREKIRAQMRMARKGEALEKRAAQLMEMLEQKRRHAAENKQQIADLKSKIRTETDIFTRTEKNLRARIAQLEEALADCRSALSRKEASLAAAENKIENHFLVPRPWPPAPRKKS